MEEEQTIAYKTAPLEKANIEIKLSTIHRYGVFAKTDIAPKEVIEECPVIIFGRLKLEYRQDIAERAFRWDDDNNCAIALGYGSIYNHSKQEPNAAYSIDRKNRLLKFIAIKPIAAGQEILIDYGDDWNNIFVAHTNKSSTKSQNSKSGATKVIALFLLLLILSKIFPLVPNYFPNTAITTKNYYNPLSTSY